MYSQFKCCRIRNIFCTVSSNAAGSGTFFVQSDPMLPDPEHFLKMRNRIQKIYNADQELIVRESSKKYTLLEANKLSGHVADPVESRALFAGPGNNRLE